MDERTATILAHIGPRIHQRRTELGLSFSEVAKRAGLSKAHVWRIETSDITNPTIKAILALCDALQCNLNSLLGIDVSEPSFTDQELALIAAHRQIFRDNNYSIKGAGV